ncbi:eukaryotic translation initiation factor 3 subunit A-like [Argiope bruennichi]|uniref:eukaryotic translation initiation factor 3 subunit A-like n=1 Tax=Argiope bruennichi TaxID=94029 RepID=UPI002495609E|nr:eukaryotic translation initiation factor 3 subunit A-like [Argiope bruennichi]
MLENLQFKKEEERKKFAEKQLKEEEAERQRLQKEAEERANQRRIFEEEKIKNLICREKIENLKKSDLGQMIEKSELNELSSVDPESLLAKQIEYARREKKEFQTRLRKQERTINHMERAKRIEEIPLLKQEHEVDKIKALEMWECDEKCRIQTLYEERSQKEKEKRLLERAVQRKAERRRIWLEQKEQLEKDNDKHFKFVRRRETKNNAKSSRERSTKKSPRCENFPEFRNEQNYLSPNRSYQAKINISNDNSTRSLPLRDNKVHMFNNHSERRYDSQANNSIEKDKNMHKKLQPKYHILKRNENPFPGNRVAKEHPLPIWCTSSNSRNDSTNFQKPFYGYVDNSTFVFSNRISTPSMLEPNSKYMYSQKYCQENCSKSRNTLPNTLLYKKNMNSDLDQDSVDKVGKHEDETDQPNIRKNIKYDVRHSCTPWAKLSRANNKT